MAKTERIRAYMFMYVQSVKNLKIKFEDIPDLLDKLGAEKYAMILHDKDVKKDGKTPTNKHIHILIKFKNARSLNNLAKAFKDKPQYFAVWKGFNNGLSYLIHETASAIQKHHYSDDEVIANFDFHKAMEAIRDQVRKSNKAVKEEIKEYGCELITRKELVKNIGVYELARNERLIDNIDAFLEMKKHKAWLKKFKGQRTENIWLWGKAGVGKTIYARHLTGNKDVAILGSSRDYFQEYHGETSVILNDLRPNDFNYGDLLRILDPFEHDKMAPRRYHDKPLNIEFLVITTPYSPWEFYQNSKIADREIDTFEQLKRRVLSIQITRDFIEKVMPDVKSDSDEWEGFA